MTAGRGQPVILMLAAGEGRRFGGAKQLVDLAGEPMCRRVARQLLALDCPLVVVTGAHAGVVEPALRDLPLDIVRNEDWPRGLGSSLGCGVRHARRTHYDPSGVLVCLGDQPLIDHRHLRRLLDRHREQPDRLLGTSHGGLTVPPVLFPADCLDELATWRKGEGARRLIEREAARVECVPVTEHPDVDTPADLMQVRERLPR